VNASIPKRARGPVAALLLAAGVAGCAMTFDATSLGVPAVMASPASQPVVGDTFTVTSRALYAFWGLYPLHRPSLENTLEGQLVGGRAVANLRIRVRRRWSDLLVTVLTAGLLNPVSVTFDGVVARAPASP
jgi:hypothetical protein